MLSHELTSIVLAVISLVSGCGWIVNRSKYMAEVKGMRADNRQKDMNLSKDYVDEFRRNIGEPLQDLVKDLRNERNKLRNALQKIDECPHRNECPVDDELQRQQEGDEDHSEAG